MIICIPLTNYIQPGQIRVNTYKKPPVFLWSYDLHKRITHLIIHHHGINRILHENWYIANIISELTHTSVTAPRERRYVRRL